LRGGRAERLLAQGALARKGVNGRPEGFAQTGGWQHSIARGTKLPSEGSTQSAALPT